MLRASLLSGLTCSVLGAWLAGCDGEPPALNVGGDAPSSAPLTTAAAGDPDDPVNAPPQLVAAAKQFLATRTGKPADTFTVTNAAPVPFPLQRINIFHFKAVDATSTFHTIALSEDGSREEDATQLEQAELALYEQANGKLVPDLVAQLAGLPNTAQLDVVIRAALPAGTAAGPQRPVPTAQQPTSAQIDSFYAQASGHRQQVIAAAATPVRERLIRSGFADATTDALTPFVYVKLPVATIREVGRWPEVTAVSAAKTFVPAMDKARAVVEADIVNTRGFSGTGIPIAAIEVKSMMNGNPYLGGVVNHAPLLCADPHPTWVAGAIRSTHGSVRGVAPASTLHMRSACSGFQSQIVTATAAEVAENTRALNLSYSDYSGTAPGSLDHYYDELVQKYWRAVVAAAGDTGPMQRVSSPGRGYNVTTVGAFADNDTIPWLGDGMSTFSNTLDPSSLVGDREKPELVAPGTNITTLNIVAPWNNALISGTSMSAPIATGTVALLMQRNTWLQVWPEAIKAIMMATAYHNITGSTRLTEQDGAGAIVATLADDVAQGVSGNWAGIPYYCNTAPATQALTTMSLTANRVTRAAVVWDTNTDYPNYTLQPSADIDAYVTGPSPSTAVVTGSGSWDNTYEMIEFVAPATGVYTLHINRYRCQVTIPDTTSPMALAWAWYHDY